MRSSAHIYQASPADAQDSLLQGELLSGLVRYTLDVKTLGTQDMEFLAVEHELAIVLTQACDLEQDFDARASEEANAAARLIPSVLFVNVTTAEKLKQTNNLNSELWRRVQQNKDERYHFLQAVEAGCDAKGEGLGELAIDFKRYFTIPTDEVYARIRLGVTVRRCALKSPYLEHMSTRFAAFLSRVALPENHFSEPRAKG